VGAEVFYAYGRTDLMKLTVVLRNFAVVPNDTHYATVEELLQGHWVLERDLLTYAVGPLTNKC